MHTRPSAARQLLVGLGLLTLVALIAVFGSLATIPNTEGWYAEVTKVPWNPPNAAFGPVWTVLYALIALAGWLCWRAGWRKSGQNAASGTLKIFAAQLALNAIWTPIFFAGYPLFGKPAWWIALATICALVLCVIWLGVSAWKWSKLAALIMIPYVIWLLIATSLNAGIIVLN